MDIFRIKNIVNALMGFVETKVELYKIQFKEEIAKALSILVLVFMFAMIGMLFILFLSHFLSHMLNDAFENDYIGYLIVTGLYLVIGIVTYLLRNQIKDSVMDMMFPDEESESEEEYE